MKKFKSIIIALMMIVSLSLFVGFGIGAAILAMVQHNLVIDDPTSSLLTLFAGAVMMFGGLLVHAAFSQVWFCLVDNPRAGVLAALRASWRMMDGHKVQYLTLSLSFIGWIVLSCLTLGLGFLWLIPYMQTTYANFYLAVRPSVFAQVKEVVSRKISKR